MMSFKIWTDAQYINMQISANVAIKIDEKEKYTLVGEVSYNPDDRNDKDNSLEVGSIIFDGCQPKFYYLPWLDG